MQQQGGVADHWADALGESVVLVADGGKIESWEMQKSLAIAAFSSIRERNEHRKRQRSIRSAMRMPRRPILSS